MEDDERLKIGKKILRNIASNYIIINLFIFDIFYNIQVEIDSIGVFVILITFITCTNIYVFRDEISVYLNKKEGIKELFWLIIFAIAVIAIWALKYNGFDVFKPISSWLAGGE